MAICLSISHSGQCICIISAIRVATMYTPLPVPPSYFKVLQKLKSSNVYIVYERNNIFLIASRSNLPLSPSLLVLSPSNFNTHSLSLSLNTTLLSRCYRSFTIYDIFILSIVYYEPRGGDYYLHVINAVLSLPYIPLLINSVFSPSI